MKTFRLTINEFIKLFSRKGVLIIFLIIVVNSFLSGYSLYRNYIDSTYGVTVEGELNDQKLKASGLRNQINAYIKEFPPDTSGDISGVSGADLSESNGSQADSAASDASSDYSDNSMESTETSREVTQRIAYYQARFNLLESETYIRVYEKALSFGVRDRDDWRYSVLYSIIIGELKLGCYNILLDDSEDPDFLVHNICVYLEISVNYTKNEIEDYILNQTKTLDSLWDDIENNNYSGYIVNAAKSIQYEISLKENEINVVNRQLEENPSSADLALAKRRAQSSSTALYGKLDALDFKLSNDVKYGSWVDNTVGMMLDNYNKYIDQLYSIVTKEYFHKNSDYYEWTYENYDEYENIIEGKLESYLNAVEIGWYSIKNDIPEMSVSDSSRMHLLDFTNMFVFFAFFGICIAGMSVSSEYTARTVYILLIKSASRSKILLSKLLCVLLTAAGLIAISFGAFLLGTVLRSGISDLYLPYLYIQGSSVVEASFLPWIMGKIVYCTASVLLLCTFSFGASILFRSSAVAIISGSFPYMASIILPGIFRSSTIYAYTPFPYFNNALFVFNDVAAVASRTAGGLFEGISVKTLYSYLWMGGLALVTIIISFAVFTKRDVKND